MWTFATPWQTCGIVADVHWASLGSAPAIASRQRRRLAALMVAAQRSPLYRERFARHGEAFEQQPPVRKSDLMSRFDDWACDRRITHAAARAFLRDAGRIGTPFLDDYFVWESSGSSGEPGVFVQDANAMAVYDALEALRRPTPWNPWAEAFGAGPRIAFVGATEGHFASTVSVERLRRLAPSLSPRLQGFSFLQPTDALVEALNRWQPQVIATYPTAALLLAEERSAGRLQLTLNEVWTGGEAMGDTLRATIAAGLGCPVRASYGASEFLALATECAHRRLHLNADWALLESVDEEGCAVPPGTTGARTLLTNLANHVQPLIRYELGDRVRFDAEPCACGSPLPTIDVQGRVDDCLLLTDRSHRSVRLLPLALTTVLEDEAGVFDFQLIQCGPSRLRLCVADPAALPAARQALRGYLQRQGLQGLQLQTVCSPPEVRGRSGKLPRIVCGAGADPGRPRARRARTQPHERPVTAA